MDPISAPLLPMLYRDVPTFLGVPLAGRPEELASADAAFVGVPFQGPPGVGREYSDSLLTPMNLRKDSIKYGGYLPELDIDVFEHVRLVDFGDVPINVRGDVIASIGSTEAKLGQVLDAGAVPISVGGTEICASFGLIKAAARRSPGRLGIITMDAHGDNLEVHSGDRWCGATWIARMAELDGVDMAHHAHIGLRGPRNMREQVDWYRQKGTRLYTAAEIKKLGFDLVMDQAISLAREGTDGIILSVDFDVLDIGAAPGLDEPLGISTADLLSACYLSGSRGIKGFAIGWVPAPSKQIHWIATWAILYLLAGLAQGRLGR